MAEVSQDDVEEVKDTVLDMCICRECPSFIECGERGGFCFPIMGKSGCITEEKGCICGKCPLHAQMGLKNMYYCIRGSEKDQILNSRQKKVE